ncbi:choice-of-anchor D domain-containing protein [Myxococcota bacterium]|nr:choice-of-anchor D domain-containing protein [Myxococcota bacterium]
MPRNSSVRLALGLGAASTLPFLGCGPDVQITSQTGVLEISPNLIDFGAIASGTEATETVNLDNTSPDVSLEVLSVALQGADAGSFTIVEGGFSGRIEASSAMPLSIAFHPTTLGFLMAELVVTTEGSEGNTVSTIDVRGESVDGGLQVYPRVVDFGPVDVGDSEEAAVIIENPTSIPIVIDEIDFSGDDGFDYDAPSYLGNLPWTVDPGDRIDIDVAFEADGTDPASAGLTLLGSTFDAIDVTLLANTCEGSAHGGWDQDGDGYQTCGGDCDDGDEDVFPGAAEVYDSIDNDCDGIVDEGTVGYDDDGDGQSELGGDCNDGDASTSTGAEEIADGRDNDCDGDVDEGTENDDGDNDGYTGAGGDCDDADANVHPGMPEDGGTGTNQGDGLDNDCDGYVDEGTTAFDDDGDGYCEEGPVCVGGADPGDCNDADPAVYPSAPETADGKDNDCDGIVDDGSPGVDDDHDGYSELGGDCDDGDNDTYPGAPELPDGIDQDCDGIVDEGTTAYDDDGDGFAEAGGDCNDGDATIYPNADEDGGTGTDEGDGRDNDCDGIIDERTLDYDDDEDGVTESAGDCNDYDPDISPATIEVPGNFIDDDCDGEIDEYGF